MAGKDEIEDIRRQMARIRREIHEDVQTMVAGAEAVADWHRYVRLYPWASLAAAFAAGFLIVPRRHRTASETARAVSAEVRQAVAAPRVEEKAKKRGLIAVLFGLVGPIALRAAQSFATHHLETWIAQQPGLLGQMTAAQQSAPGRGPGRPDPSGRR